MTEYQRKSEESIRFHIDLANKVYKKDMPYPVVRWTLRGTTAGRAFTRKWTINLHPVLCNQEGDKFVSRTPAHEVAHLVADRVFGVEHRGSQRSYHGQSWKCIMHTFGLDSTRCHSYNTIAVRQKRRRGQKYIYCCTCREFEVGPTRHRRMRLEGRSYFCKSCKSQIQYVAAA